jgi:acyl-CoA thioesterase II
MERLFASLVELLELEELDRDLYRARNEVAGTRRNLFGGQVAAQALRAAAMTVPPDRHPHSFHGYFLRNGSPERPIILQVARDRDGGTYSARRVSAVQRGEVIFSMAASFQAERDGAEFGVPMAEGVPGPEDCPPYRFRASFPLIEAAEFPPPPRDVPFQSPSRYWMRFREPLGDDLAVHGCALAYISDIGNGYSTLDLPDTPLGGPSLSHSLWYHASVRADDWVLLDMWPLMVGASRGLYTGAIHARSSGRLACMLTQENLLNGFGRDDRVPAGA